MRLKFNQIEVEGKDQKEIEWLLKKIDELIEKFPQNSPNSSNGDGRGRTKSFIDWPHEPFIVNELAEKLGISTACLYQRLKLMEGNGDAKVVNYKRIEGQRGRPTPIWQVINFETQGTVGNTSTRFEAEIDLDNVPD